MWSARTSIEYIIKFLKATWKKFKVILRRAYAGIANVFPKGFFYTDKQMNVIYWPIRLICFCFMTMFL